MKPAGEPAGFFRGQAGTFHIRLSANRQNRNPYRAFARRLLSPFPFLPNPANRLRRFRRAIGAIYGHAGTGKREKQLEKPLPPAGFSPYPLKRETLRALSAHPAGWTATPLRRSLPLQNRPCSAPGMYFGKPWIFLPFPQTVRGKPL